jgi:hypothetical protein
MSDEEVEADRRNDTAWDRPTWLLGTKGPNVRYPPHDPFGIYEENTGRGPVEGDCHGPDHGRPRPHSEQARALTTLELTWPVTLKKLKDQYKKLVKVHHPDANNGNKLAEERFKTISEAYAVMTTHLNEFEKAKAR